MRCSLAGAVLLESAVRPTARTTTRLPCPERPGARSSAASARAPPCPRAFDPRSPGPTFRRV